MNNKDLILRLEKWFANCEGSITAFSGGVDSALVLFLSRKFLGKQRSIGVISNSESLKSSDYEIALHFAETNDILLETIYTKEMSDSKYHLNPGNRCYFCKTHLYTAVHQLKEKYPSFLILNGTNKDDYKDYRPGLKAANENDIRSPLADNGLRKEDVRSLAKYFGIPLWNKPASPCLSSRIPYGDLITKKKLSQVEKAEEILLKYGFNEVRVRHFEKKCSIEVPINQIESLGKHLDVISSAFKDLGFDTCSIDEDGLVSGKLNHVLNLSNV